MHAFIITGSTKADRVKRAKEIFKKEKISEIITLETESKHLIQDVRFLNHRLSISATDQEKGRGVLIVEANLLTLEAANSFLKTLEDPPGKTLIVLTSPNPESVLETILSRSTQIDLGTKQIEITDEDKKSAIARLAELSQAPIAKRLEIAEKLSDRTEALEFCTKQIYAAREAMVNKKTLTTRDAVSLLENLEQTREDLEANVNVKLTIGQLLLNYPQK